GLIFYDTKVTVMNRVLNATVQRTADHAAPEITLDPLEIVGGEIRSSENSYFCQAARQLSCVPSSQLCVKLASGGDPTYAFNIRFTGEEVHGTSKCTSARATSTRQGHQGVTRVGLCHPKELRSLRGGPAGEEKGIPSCIWLLGCPCVLCVSCLMGIVCVLPLTDTAKLKSRQISFLFPKGSVFFIFPRFTLTQTAPASASSVPCRWENKDVYAAAIRSLRLRELQSPECMTAVRAGLGSIIPLQLLTTLTPLEMELRTCGLPYINLEFLKAHTMYQVGLMETDQHIEFFWSALEMFTQEELCKFIKFACNQERIPFTCPCKDGGPDTAHVPPYPMKIAPPRRRCRY
ncbi:HECD4 ligase, partial [Xiphorhynchus elegans]|nr:HECD4 ligase [Xiphorhynchus elegans]